SRNNRSKSSLSNAESPFWPSPATVTLCPARSNSRRIVICTAGSSSTTRILAKALPPDLPWVRQRQVVGIVPNRAAFASLDLVAIWPALERDPCEFRGCGGEGKTEPKSGHSVPISHRRRQYHARGWDLPPADCM